jgi:hypothetical protein
MKMWVYVLVGVCACMVPGGAAVMCRGRAWLVTAVSTLFGEAFF